MEFPTGGMCARFRQNIGARARERPPPLQNQGGGVSRSGATPEPTVTVRMEENGMLPGLRHAFGAAPFTPPKP